MGEDQFARFQYFQWEDRFYETKPYVLFMDKPEGFSDFPDVSFNVEKGPEEKVTDIRGSEHLFDLDTHAFAIRKHKLELDEFNEKTVVEKYYPSVERLLKSELGDGIECYFFDWRLRSSDKRTTDLDIGGTIGLEDTSIRLPPLSSVHVDQSPSAAIQRVLYHMGDRAEELLKGRVRIINLWRPIIDSIEDCPLAVCDGGRVPFTSCATADFVRKHYIGESLYPLPNENYRWYYLSKHNKDEALIMKMSDTDESVMARWCPHASFMIPNPPPGYVHRQSIEVRALVFGP